MVILTLGDGGGNANFEMDIIIYGQYTYSNGSSHERLGYTQSTTGGVYGRMSGYVGDGSDDTELTSIEMKS